MYKTLKVHYWRSKLIDNKGLDQFWYHKCFNTCNVDSIEFCDRLEPGEVPEEPLEKLKLVPNNPDDFLKREVHDLTEKLSKMVLAMSPGCRRDAQKDIQKVVDSLWPDSPQPIQTAFLGDFSFDRKQSKSRVKKEANLPIEKNTKRLRKSLSPPKNLEDPFEVHRNPGTAVGRKVFSRVKEVSNIKIKLPSLPLESSLENNDESGRLSNHSQSRSAERKESAQKAPAPVEPSSEQTVEPSTKLTPKKFDVKALMTKLNSKQDGAPLASASTEGEIQAPPAQQQHSSMLLSSPKKNSFGSDNASTIAPEALEFSSSSKRQLHPSALVVKNTSGGRSGKTSGRSKKNLMPRELKF